MYSSAPSLISVLDKGGSITTRPGRFTHGNDPLHIVQEVGWALGLVWMGAEKLTSTGIRSPDRPEILLLLLLLLLLFPLRPSVSS